jgi:RNA polymerase sigma-70 factor (ECF subfamily)
VWRFIARLIGEAEADDIAQVTFIKFYRNLARIDPPEAMRAYLFKIARNSCTDLLRSQGRYTVDELDETNAPRARVTFSGSTPAPEDATHWLLLLMDVRAAMNDLPELQRQTLILYAEEKLSIEEIAGVMDTQPGTVKSRLHHARKTLRRLLPPGTVAALEEG